METTTKPTIPEPVLSRSNPPVLADIDAHRALIDRRLRRPAVWRGVIRRELRGTPHPHERERVARAFDRLVDEHRALTPDIELLLDLQREVVGERGLRERPAIVRSATGVVTRDFPAAAQVRDLTVRAIASGFNEGEHPALAAARMHLDLLRIHPLRDGNGRVARLLASCLLLRAGYRSTLLTAVEQHFHASPADYTLAFHDLWAGRISDVDWLELALRAMAGNCALAAAARAGTTLDLANPYLRREAEYQRARLAAEEAADPPG